MSKDNFIRLNQGTFTKVNSLDMAYMSEFEKQDAIAHTINTAYKTLELYGNLTLTTQEKEVISQFIFEQTDTKQSVTLQDLYEELLTKNNTDLVRLIELLKRLI